MPYTVNGVGTTYYGKKNPDEHIGVCQYCNQRVALQDYDTRHWFVIFFIPIVPLGKKRILNYCSACSRHHVVKLHEWEEGTQAAMKEGMEALRDNPDSAEAMVQAHATFTQTGKRDEALKLAKVMREKFPDDVDIHLYLITWYESVGMNKEVDECIEHAYAIDPENPFACRGMALTCIERNELTKARELLEKFKPGTELYEPALFVHLANACQAQGDNESAGKIHEMLLETSPELSSSKEFRKTVKKNSQALGTTALAMETPPLYKHPVVIGIGIVALLLIGVTCWSFYLKNNRTIHVVNGMPVPITFQIDDHESQIVPPHSRITTTVAEGGHQVELISPEVAKTKTHNFRIESDFVGRLIDNRVTVLDPAQSAIVGLMYEYYAENPDQDPGVALKSNRFHVCQPVTQFQDIDYVFTEFPAQVSMGQTEQVVEKNQLRLIAIPEDQTPMLQYYEIEPTQIYKYAKRHLEIDSTTEGLITSLVVSAQNEKQWKHCIQLLKKQISESPDTTLYHHLAIYCAREMSAEEEIIDYYDQLITQHPESPEIHFIRGYFYEHLSESKAHWEKTLEISPDFGEAHRTLANRAYALEQYEQALKHYEKAIKNQGDAIPGNELEQNKCYCLLALNREQELLDFTKGRENEFWTVLGRWYLEQKQPEKFQEMVDKAHAQLMEGAPAGVDDSRSIYELMQFYHQGKHLEYLNLLVNEFGYLESSISTMEIHLLLDRPEQAERLFQNLEPEDHMTAQFLFSIFHARHGEMENSKQWFQKGIESLRQGELTERYAAEVLSKKNISKEELFDLNILGIKRQIIFAATAMQQEHLKEPIRDHHARNKLPEYLGEQLIKNALGTTSNSVLNIIN